MRNRQQLSSDAVEDAMIRVALGMTDPDADMGYFDPRNASEWYFLIAGSDKPVIDDKSGFGIADNKEHEVPRGLQSLLTPAEFDALDYYDRVIVRFWGACLVVSMPDPNQNYFVEWHESPRRAAAALQVLLRERYAAKPEAWREERGIL